MVSKISNLIFTEALRQALLPRPEEGKRSVRGDGDCGDDGFVMGKENVGGDWIAWTIGIELETSRLRNRQIQCQFSRFMKLSVFIYNGRLY